MTYRKIVITVCLLCLSLVGFAQFDTWIVDNNLQSPTGSHIFSDLSAAITVAAVGDVIYVKASPTPYANSIINKGITIVGEGFKGQAATIDQLTIGMDASNTAIHGLKITDQLVFNSAVGVGIDLSNILISYNFIEEILWNSGGTTDSIRNLDIQSNIIGSGQTSAGTEALYLNTRTAGTLFIENNVFFGSTSSGASIRASGAFISRNAFIGTGTEKAFDHISNCSVSSNIFFGRSAEALDGTSSGNSFSNNYAFSTSDDTFANVIGVIGTTGASPNSNTDPRLVNIILSTAWDFDLFTIDYDYPFPADPPPIGPAENSFSETGKWLPTISSMSGVVELLEGSNLSLDVTAFVDNGIHDAAGLTSFEYFFDDNDLGFASNIISTTVPSGASFLGQLDFVTNGLAAGSHVLYLRVADENRWGLYKSYPIYIVDNAIAGFDINAAEYFFNLDPGVGLAMPITISRTNTLNLLETVDASSLTTGFHNLFIRVGDQHGRWGLPQSKLLYVDNSSPAIATIIQAVEYYFNNDPGYGAATPLTIPSTANSIDFTDAIVTTDLDPGFHNLFIRAQDDGGIWGLTTTKLLYVDPSGAGLASSIGAFEYFFDDDPGYGAATAITVSTPANEVNLLETLVATSLTTGFHNLFIRAQDEGGIWSIPISKLVYVDQSGAGSITSVQALEYFFDEDPGYGAATAITVSTPANEVNLLETLDATSLTTGFHNLFIRSRDDGGTWGLPISKLVYVDPSGAGSLTPVQDLEYFFDDDPGYGLASTADLTDGASIDELITASASTLDLGFHNLFIRIQDLNGIWSLPVSKLLYVDQAGNVNVNISEMEYFFDTDPGYGAGLSILVDPAESDPIRKLILNAASLPAGNHTLGVRAKNESDVWGITAYEPFISFPPSRELDSVSLIVFYNQTDGDNWDQNSGWISGSLDTWYGVTLLNNRVDSIKLGSNNLSGVLPKPLGYVDEVTYMSLAENILKDTIPSTFTDLNKLVTLRLHANQFNEIPDLSSITTLQNIALDSNYFDFGDLEPFASVPNLSYDNQKVFNDFQVDSIVSIGQSVTINKLIEGVNNSYQWYLDNNPIEFADLEDYEISNFNSSDTGTYVLRVNNSVLSDIELETQPFSLGIPDLQEDSLAMVSLYNALGGTAWTGVSGWLTSGLGSWTGVTLENQRVTSLNLASRNLKGKLPADFIYADSLITLNLSGNAIQDTVPETFRSLSFLKDLNIASNRITSIPELNNLANLNTLNVSQNILQFGDLEKNIGIPQFLYALQDSIGVFADTVVDVNSNLLIERKITGPNNTYQWLLNGAHLTGNATANSDAILVETIEFADEGNYVLEVKNTQITDLTLHTKAFNLGVSSLERDSKALLALYDATDGDNWSTPVNWKTADIATAPWVGVTLGGTNSDRVTAIDLSEFGLKDTIPTDIRDITSLQIADLADNEIAALPNMSGMPNITSLNLNNNKLVFRYLIPNRNISGISFINQKRFGQTLYDTLDAGEDVVLDAFTGIDFGKGTVLQWNFGELVPGQLFNNDVQPIANANASSFLLENVNINSQGTYRLSTTHPDIPGMSIESRNQNILAKTDFIGSVSLNGIPVTDTEVVVWRKTASGPFSKEDSTLVDDEGNYILKDVVLGTFIVLARPNTTLPKFSKTIQTYYISADTYSEANELLLDGVTQGININLIEYIKFSPGSARISGVVESEFDDDIIDEENNRVNARRKVKKAACAMRRFKAQGRDEDDHVEEEIAYYIETDDEGFFDFTNVADGKYLLSIEFPGVPISENAQVEFEIGGDRENQVFDVNVLITEAGIEVTQEEILFNLKPYLKDINIYPNPTDGLLALDYLVYREIDDLKMQLISAQGVILVDQEVDRRRGLHHAEIDLTQYDSGIYYLMFTDEAGTFAHPVKIARK